MPNSQVRDAIRFGRCARVQYSTVLAAWLRNQCDFENREAAGEIRYSGNGYFASWLIVLEGAPNV